MLRLSDTVTYETVIFYRKMISDVALLGGGSNSDYGANASWRIRPGIELNALGQHDRWNFPNSSKPHAPTSRATLRIACTQPWDFTRTMTSELGGSHLACDA